jgi:hypothetical protein
MFTSHLNRLPFAFLLVVGLLSGCAEDVPPEPRSSFPVEPDVYVAVRKPDVNASPGCVVACCGIPDEVLVVDVLVDNWLLVPHDECGDEPQCGPLEIELEAGVEKKIEFETFEETFTIDVQEIAGSLESWPQSWVIVAKAVPPPGVDFFPTGLDVDLFNSLDEAQQREREVGLCHLEEDSFFIHTDIAPTTAPGTYVMRANLDDVEVACTFEVITGEDGQSAIELPADDDCAPAGLVNFYYDEVIDSPDGSNPRRRAKIKPRKPVASVSLEVSRGGEILATGSHQPTGEITYPVGEECSFTPCLTAPAWGLTL